MHPWEHWLAEHQSVTRRHFLRIGAAGAALLSGAQGLTVAEDAAAQQALAEAVAALPYLTPDEKFGTVERGDPLPYTHPPEKLREVGLTRETWTLEVVSDPEHPPRLGAALSHAAGTALDWNALMALAEKHAVRFLKIMTCNNIESPLGMGLWEGVPLRHVVWRTKPTGDLRRLFYHGYHNDDPKQLFQSSLPIGRVLEEPPGDYPVILAYKLNGEWLSGKRGGPVRMIVPEAYGFKSVKWLKRVILSNIPAANDTYIGGNNDIDSPMKTFAQFVSRPLKVKAGEPIPVTGLAQVGQSGLSNVQWWLHPQAAEWPADDPYYANAPWADAEVLPPPARWTAESADEKQPVGRLPDGTLGRDAASGRPRDWPMRYALAHWAALLPGQPAGRYHLRCRSIDANGIAQPLPRPFPKSGRVNIQQVELIVE